MLKFYIYAQISRLEKKFIHLTAGLAYYISLKKAPMLSANLKSVYDEEFNRARDNDRERVSFRVEPAVAYRP